MHYGMIATGNHGNFDSLRMHCPPETYCVRVLNKGAEGTFPVKGFCSVP